ncbi:MAG: hypothetical protein Q8K55_08115, partial [Gemmatimonadaceae bacterium]|nr:hypothetical protein [Gemmatimonadaceae bacterium]
MRKNSQKKTGTRILCRIFGIFLLLAGSIPSLSRADEVRIQGIAPERHRTLEERVKELERKMDFLYDAAGHSGSAVS